MELSKNRPEFDAYFSICKVLLLNGNHRFLMADPVSIPAQMFVAMEWIVVLSFEMGVYIIYICIDVLIIFELHI